MDLVGYLVIGLVAGAVSGWFVGIRSVDGFLPTLAVGMVGAAIGGWLSQALGASPDRASMGAALFAIVGAVVVRLALKMVERRR
jgi:uncharacterized membrane protein YeaQ/YmgE (transglycosylase-associated protein family)